MISQHYSLSDKQLNEIERATQEAVVHLKNNLKTINELKVELLNQHITNSNLLDDNRNTIEDLEELVKQLML